SQPITPPVTTRRPSAAMPLAYPFGEGQPLGWSICGVLAGASPFASGSIATVGLFDVLTTPSPSSQVHSFRGDAWRPGLRHLPQSKSLQLAGLRLGQLIDKFDGARIFVRRNRALDMLLQGARHRSIGCSTGSENHICLDDHPARLVGSANHAALGN